MTVQKKIQLVYIYSLVIFLFLWVWILLIPEKLEVEAESSFIEKGPSLVLVIDDVGYSIRQLEPFLEIPFPVTFAILPFLDYSQEALKRIQETHHQAILHMPMAPLGSGDPGPGAILPEDSIEVVRLKTLEAIRSLPGIAGVNNHMGSGITSDLEKMKVVLDAVYEEGLFFLDSVTTHQSKVPEAAKSREYPYLERDVFLDNNKDQRLILRALEEGKKIAKEKGHAVMIGHIWTEELAQILLDIYPDALDEGYSLDDLTSLITGMSESDDDSWY